jgi:AcrR family transcriptional regulator
VPSRRLEPRKKPTQERSRATVDAVLEGAARILASGSLEDLTLARIARRAGLSVGSIYRYFPTKDAIILALVRREQDRFADRIADTVASLEAASLETTIASLAVRSQFVAPRLRAAVDDEERRLILGRDDELEERLMAVVERALERHRSRLEVPCLRTAAMHCVVIARALTDAARHAPVPPRTTSRCASSPPCGVRSS